MLMKVVLFLCLPGLDFTWRGESGAALRLESPSLSPSGYRSLLLLLFLSLLLISSPPTTMLCWGNARDGQLGIGVERNPVFEPRNCHVFSGRGLKEVVCGGQHTLFLLHDGSVYTCGSNSCGQLGRNKDETSPGKQNGCQHTSNIRFIDLSCIVWLCCSVVIWLNFYGDLLFICFCCYHKIWRFHQSIYNSVLSHFELF